MNRNAYYSIYTIKNNKGKKIFDKKDNTIILPTIESYFEIKYMLNRFEEIFDSPIEVNDAIVLNFFEELVFELRERDYLVYNLKSIVQDIQDEVFKDSMKELIEALESLTEENCDEFIFKQSSLNNSVSDMFEKGTMRVITQRYDEYKEDHYYHIENVQ